MESAEFSRINLSRFRELLIIFSCITTPNRNILWTRLRTPLFLILEDIEKYRYLVLYCIVSWKVWVPNNAVQECSHFLFIVVVIIFRECVKIFSSFRSHMSYWYTIVILFVYHCVRIFISVITKNVFTLTTRTNKYNISFHLPREMIRTIFIQS